MPPIAGTLPSLAPVRLALCARMEKIGGRRACAKSPVAPWKSRGVAGGPGVLLRPPSNGTPTFDWRAKARAAHNIAPVQRRARLSGRPMRGGPLSGRFCAIAGRSALRFGRSLARLGRVSGRPVSTGTRYSGRYSADSGQNNTEAKPKKAWHARQDSNLRPPA